MPNPQFLNDTASSLRELATHLQMRGGVDAIDWTKVKQIIAALVQTLGPILLTLLVDWLTPVAPPAPKPPIA
jgi:hypothetical protein